MSRTIQEIYEAILLEKESHTELDALVPNPDLAQDFLDDLTSSSKVAIWRHMFWNLAVAIHVHEEVFDDHQAELTAFGDTLIGGNARWLQAQCLLYRYDEALVFDTDLLKFVYPAGAGGSLIITNAAVIEGNGQALIKVAKTGPAPLSAGELAGFSKYIEQIKFAGTFTLISSLDADDLRVEYDVHFDPQVMAPDGSLISDGGVFPVEDAINDYITGLPFNGVLNLTALTDQVQQAEGVNDPILKVAKAATNGQPLVDIDREYEAAAGYLQISPSFPLNVVTNYISD